MNPFFTKSIFLWTVPAVLRGDPVRIAEALSDAGFEAVIFKVADGPWAFSPLYTGWSGENLQPAMIRELKARGIAVLGYGFLYGANPTGEADIAVTQTYKHQLDGYVFDVEGAFDSRGNAEANAHTVMTRYRRSCPETPAAYCGWALYRNPRNPTTQWHPIAVARAFMQYCDVGMPMVYWDGETVANALWWISNCLDQWKEITNKPIIPAGRAYNGDGARVTVETMAEFERYIRGAGGKGVTWWSMQHAIALSGIWPALEMMGGYRPITPPDPGDSEPPPLVEGVRYRVISDTLNVRSVPTTINNKALRTLRRGDVVTVTGVAGSDAWIEIGPGEFCALQTAGKQYLERVK